MHMRFTDLTKAIPAGFVLGQWMEHSRNSMGKGISDFCLGPSQTCWERAGESAWCSG